MKQVIFSDLRDHAKHYFDIVESGESVRIVRNGKPIADIVPLQNDLPSWKRRVAQPLVINGIFATKGDVLYDPAKVSQKVLVEQGCGEYTNSIDKSKAALAARGVKKPLVIKASGATTAADLQVTDDAVTIYSANQKGNFMAAAKVAFVLK